jgi:ATP/maltotriose-dependent transcriptional regulator MalT
MTMPLLATKLYIPPPRPNIVRRSRLIARLNEGLERKLTLLSAPAGFGKTTLLSDWIAGCERQVAWLSLDEGDSDPTRFLAYLVAALRTIAKSIGAVLLGALQSSQPPPLEAVLTALLNDLTTLSDPFVLVLDDYHVLDAQPVDQTLAFLLEHLPPQIHMYRQPEPVQEFLRRTSILNRLSGPLCDAVLLAPSGSGQATLEYLERTNLFIAPLDNERRWYRYHHLFAELLRQRLQQGTASAPADEGKVDQREGNVAELHRRASVWYEEQGLELEAFHHAAAAQDVDHAERLIEGNGMPLHFRGAVAPVLDWLNSLPSPVLDTRPMLQTAYASVLLATGQVSAAEQKLLAAQRALEGAEPDDTTRDLIGRIAAIRATAAVSQHQVETIITQSHRALEYLHPDNLAFRTSTAWKLGYAYQLKGDRAAARQAYSDVISISQASGNLNFTVMATIGLGNMQEADNQLHQAAETWQGRWKRLAPTSRSFRLVTMSLESGVALLPNLRVRLKTGLRSSPPISRMRRRRPSP